MSSGIKNVSFKPIYSLYIILAYYIITIAETDFRLILYLVCVDKRSWENITCGISSLAQDSLQDSLSVFWCVDQRQH